MGVWFCIFANYIVIVCVSGTQNPSENTTCSQEMRNIKINDLHIMHVHVYLTCNVHVHPIMFHAL